MKGLAIVFFAIGFAMNAQTQAPASMNKTASQQGSQATPSTVQGLVQSMDKTAPQNSNTPVSPSTDTTGQVSMKRYFLRETAPQLRPER